MTQADSMLAWAQERAVADRAPSETARAALGVFWITLALLALGLLVQISHASTTLPRDRFVGEVQSLFVLRGAGLVALGMAFLLGPRGIVQILPYLLGGVLLLLVLAYIPGFESRLNGSRRWVNLPGIPFSLQPSELARVVGVTWVAWRCSLLGEDVRDARRGYLPMLAMGGLMAALILGAPDLGGTLLFLVCYLAVLFVGGARLTHMGASAAVGLLGCLVVMASAFHYVRDRIAIWLGDSQNDQVTRAMEAIASGDGFGVGVAQGGFRNQSLQYMQTDYVFSLVGEELGLAGSLLVIGLFLALLFQGQRLVRSLNDPFASLAAFGLILSVVVQAMLHLQVVTGLAPPKGMNLPFVSDGGSALLATCLAIGLALGAARGQGALRGSSHPSPPQPKKS